MTTATYTITYHADGNITVFLFDDVGSHVSTTTTVYYFNSEGLLQQSVSEGDYYDDGTLDYKTIRTYAWESTTSDSGYMHYHLSDYHYLWYYF